MSWSIDLKANREIPARSVATALRKIGAIDDGFRADEWGWSCEVDVSFPVCCLLSLSGAGFSRDKAEPFAKKLASALRRLHFKISVGEVRS